jgi:hypothetical protein
MITHPVYMVHHDFLQEAEVHDHIPLLVLIASRKMDVCSTLMLSGEAGRLTLGEDLIPMPVRICALRPVGRHTVSCVDLDATVDLERHIRP